MPKGTGHAHGPHVMPHGPWAAWPQNRFGRGHGPRPITYGCPTSYGMSYVLWHVLGPMFHGPFLCPTARIFPAAQSFSNNPPTSPERRACGRSGTQSSKQISPIHQSSIPFHFPSIPFSRHLHLHLPPLPFPLLSSLFRPARTAGFEDCQPPRLQDSRIASLQ